MPVDSDLKCKPFKTLDEQLQLLEERGLRIGNKEYARQALASINYYRLSAYSLTYRENDVFYDNVSFEDILAVYYFDAALRSLILEFSKKIETSLRTQLAYVHSKNHGPLGYLSSENFIDPWHHAFFLARLQKLLEDSREVFILHHKEDLDGIYPLWVAVEVMTFDVSSKCFQNMLKKDKNEISKYYGVKPKFIDNWMRCVVIARNIAAHGGRFYNRPLATKLLVPKILRDKVPCDKVFGYIYAIYHLLVEDEIKSVFIVRLSQLFKSYNKALLKHLGFPDDWKDVIVQ